MALRVFNMVENFLNYILITMLEEKGNKIISLNSGLCFIY